MGPTLNMIIAVIVSYLIGSIPFGYLAGKIVKGIDIRTTGSGNVGATNVFRSVGKTAGVVVLLADALKGVLAVMIATKIIPQPYTETLRIVSGVTAICGHNWTIFLKFKGGKGVATSTGVMLTLAPWATLTGLIVFVLAVFISRYISVGSILAASFLPFFVGLYDCGNYILLYFSVVVAILIDVRHIPNIKRLMAHTEHKFSFKKRPDSTDLK